MLCKYPPMGWNSWDCYGASVTEDIVRQNADYMAEHLKPYGWEYVVVDIQWSRPNAVNHSYEPFSELTMDEYGRLTPALNRFPSAKDGAGFRPLADYVHSLGLKFGIHIMRGLPADRTAGRTCPDSIGRWNTDPRRCDRKRDCLRSEASCGRPYGACPA